MRTVTLSFPQLALIAGTRAMAAAGVALLLGDRLDRSQRRAVGMTLVAVGALTTLPLAAEVITAARRPRADQASMPPSPEVVVGHSQPPQMAANRYTR